MKKSVVCLLLTITMCLSLFPLLGTEASASGSQQQAMIDAAMLHMDETAKDFPDVGFDWCVYFTNYCANDAGLASPESSPRSNIFPPIGRNSWKDNNWAAAGVTYQINWFTKYSHGKLCYFKDSSYIEKNTNTIKCGEKNFEPIPGDLIYIDHSKSVYDHVAIVYSYDRDNKVVYYIGGNQDDYDWRKSRVSCREVALNSEEVAGFLRPNYTTEYEDPNGAFGIVMTNGAGCTYDGNCPSKDFTDVATNVWYHQSLDYCASHDLFKGTSKDKFTPNGTMTRAMMIMVLYRLDGCPDASELSNPFKDVDDNTWCIDAIKWAYDTGVTEGYADKTFGTNIKITRAQAAKMLYCYALYKNLDCSKTADYSKFADADEVGQWAVPAIKWALGNEIIRGVTETRLNPNGSATRAQLAAILARYAQYYNIFNLKEETPTETAEPTATPEPAMVIEQTEAPEQETILEATTEPTVTSEPAENTMQSENQPAA